jgi:hypothetical protein
VDAESIRLHSASSELSEFPRGRDYPATGNRARRAGRTNPASKCGKSAQSARGWPTRGVTAVIEIQKQFPDDGKIALTSGQGPSRSNESAEVQGLGARTLAGRRWRVLLVLDAPAEGIPGGHRRRAVAGAAPEGGEPTPPATRPKRASSWPLAATKNVICYWRICESSFPRMRKLPT